MRTTIDLPDPLYRRVKAVAVERGVSLKVLFREAVERALDGGVPVRGEPSWVTACKNPPFRHDTGEQMLEALAESDRIDLELQASTPDPWA